VERSKLLISLVWTWPSSSYSRIIFQNVGDKNLLRADTCHGIMHDTYIHVTTVIISHHVYL